MHSHGGSTPMQYGNTGSVQKKCAPDTNGWKHGLNECPYRSSCSSSKYSGLWQSAEAFHMYVSWSQQRPWNCEPSSIEHSNGKSWPSVPAILMFKFTLSTVYDRKFSRLLSHDCLAVAPSAWIVSTGVLGVGVCDPVGAAGPGGSTG